MLSALLSAFASAFSQENRQFSLAFSDTRFDGELLPHRLAGEEHVSRPYRFVVECLCASVTIELKALIGVGVDLVINGPVERTIAGVVTGVERVASDGGFTRYALTVEPALAALMRRRSSRVFQERSVPEIVGLILDEHIERNPLFAECFRYCVQSSQDYPARSYCLQHREADFAFIDRLLREEGINYRFEFEHEAGQPGLHTLVLFDSGAELPAAAQSRVRFHRADATEAEDSITQWHSNRRIQPGAVALASFDYKDVYTQCGVDSTALDHGDSGSGLAAALESYDPQSLYYGADNAELSRYAQLRQRAHDLRGKTFTGAGVVRGLGAGHTFTLDQHPDHERDNQFVVLRQAIAACNNLPGEFDNHPLAKLDIHPLAKLGSHPRTATGLTLEEPGYKSQFDAVRKHIPLVPDYAQTSATKPTAPGVQTATVVGPVGEEIFTDAFGRIKIQFHWARPQDHHPAKQGAGADNNDFSSCWVRVGYPSAGAQWGHQFIPRVGQEVLVEFIEGDIDRPLIMGALHNGQHPTPTFQNAGSLPANKTLSGIKTKEYQSNRHNEILFDDTIDEIRATLSTEHGKTQLNQGFLIHPREEGSGTPRGEGLELRTDNAGALRTANGLLLTTEPHANASGGQLDRHTFAAQLDAAASLADALGATAKVQNANQPETGKSNQTITLDSQGGAIKANGHLHHLKEATANLERATNTDPGAKGGQGDQAGQQPLLLMFGQSGLAITTPHSATLTSGSNLDQIALRDIQQSSGKRWLHNTGESISLFVTGAANSLSETFKILAAKGDVQMQAQSGDMEITADKQIRLHAIRQNQAWAAQKNILITCGGAYIKLEGGNIELHCPGTLTFRGNQHGVTGPASLRAELPALPSTAFRGWMDLDLDGFEGAPIKNVPYDPQRVNAEEFTGGVDNLLQQESAQYAATDSHGGED